MTFKCILCCFIEDSNRYLKCYQKMDKYFVETKTYQTAEKMFETNGIIIFTGPPGCGKTMAAIHLLGKKGQDRTFRKIRVLEELSYIEKDKKSLILIDNIFFRRPMDLQLEKWWDKLDEIYDKYFAGSENEMETNNLRIVITARPNVIDRACEFMEKVTPILNKRFIIDTNKLTKAEKGQILAKQIEFAKIEKRILVPDIKDAFKDEVMNSEGPIGFPLCAHLYVFGEDYQKSGIQFFSRPIEYLILQIKDEIESDKTNRTKSLLFSLFFHEWHTKMRNADSFDIQNEGLCELCLRKVSPNILAHFSPFDFRELESEAQRLTGTFFKEVGEHSYKFLHDSVYEAMAAYLCETYVSETAKYFPLDIIQHQDYKKMTKRQRPTLATRLLYETLDQRLSDVFSCKIFQNREFMDCFCDEIMKRDRETIFKIFTVPNNASAARLSCMFWASCNNLTHLTERFYDIIQEREINAEYQLYVALYGLCCARNRGLLKTINGMLCDNNEQIKKHVKDFKDSSENSILHLLLLSDFTDEFVANSVKILLEANMPVNVKNNEKVTPLMLAVEQVLPRMKVIKNLIDVPAKPMLHNQDNTVSTVFHHCLGSNNDDKTCVECLKIILEGKDAKDCLSKNDINGDTALSIAARCSEHSRIVSIFKLLESDLNIINTLNEEGYSPLHLAVKSLKDTKITVELECCVRVIIFILYGDNPDKMSDADKKAVQECHYGLVQNILQNPKDEKNMKKALKTILAKLQCTQCKDISEEKLKKIKEFIPSYKICSEIQACIAKAVFHFEHQF